MAKGRENTILSPIEQAFVAAITWDKSDNLRKTGGIMDTQNISTLSDYLANHRLEHPVSQDVIDSKQNKRTYVVPRLQSGMFVNVLTNSEKAYLEYVMGLEYNALSIFNKNNNFWDDSNPDGISRVTLTKQDNRLNLSNPEEYIKYKILLANKDFIAPSMQALEDKPKATYEFVIISEGEETKVAKQNMSTTMQCYKEFGKIEDDKEKLRVIVEILDGRPTAPNVKLEFLQTKVNELIQASSKLFLKVITDPLLDTKVLIRRSLEKGTIFKKGDYHYLKDGTPMCEINQEPTFNIAAKFLNLPKNQEVKFSLEAKLK